MPKAQFRRSLCLFSHRCPLGGVFVGYTRGIHGVFMGYTYVSGMCRVCIGYVSGMCRRRRGAKQGMLLTTDEHGFARKHEIYILGSVKVSEVQWSIHNRGKMFLDGRYTNHGRARMGTEKTEDIINDNIDNLRPNQYPLGAKRSRLLTTDEHGFAWKHGNTETLRYGNTEIYDYNNLNNINQQQLQSTPFAHEAHRGPRRSQQHSER